MGIIKRQSIKNTVVNYLGVTIGAISVIFIYPIIDKKDLGIIQFTLNTAILFSPLAAFASSLTAIQFFPHFKDDKNKNNGYLFILTVMTSLSSLIFIALIYIFREPVSSIFEDDKAHFLSTLPYLLGFTFLIALANLYNAYASIFNRIVVPSILQNLLIKITLPILVILFAYQYISFADVYKGMALTLFTMLLGLILYIGYLGQLNLKPNLSKMTPQLAKEMFHYSGFNIIVSLGGMLAQRVDMLLIKPLTKDFGNVAVFNFGFVIAEAIDVPRKALSSIAAPLISNSMTNGDIPHVAEIYRKSALLQFIAGVYLLAGVWACADFLFDMMPKNGDEYRLGKNVILILGLSRLVDMATGTNAEIITYSQYYRFNFTSLLVMAIMNVALNFLFILGFGWGIEGSAYATLWSITIVNIWRLIFIYNKLKIQPLDIKMLWVVLFGIVAWGIAFYVPTVSNPFMNIVFKGAVVTIIYALLIIGFNISKDVNDMVRKYIKI